MMAKQIIPSFLAKPKLSVETLSPQKLLGRIEAALLTSDLDAANNAARLGVASFPKQSLFRTIVASLAQGDLSKILETIGCERPWHLGRIPRKAHFYWGSERTSYLRYLSVASFHWLNPDWEINIYVPSAIHRGETNWHGAEAYEGNAYHGRNYSDLLYDLPGVIIREVDFSKFPEIDNAPETSKADFFRWHILSEEGGLYSDTDILFLRSIRETPFNVPENALVQACICLHDQLHSIGFYLSAPGTAFFRAISEGARKSFNHSEYQAIGALLLNRMYPTVSSIQKAHPQMPLLNLPMELVYPLDWNRIDAIHQPGDLDQFSERTLGIHWYAGSPLTQRFNNLIDHESCGRFGTLLDSAAARMVQQMASRETKASPEILGASAPQFSILLVPGNSRLVAATALESLTNQTIGDWEALVLDDRSHPTTSELLTGYVQRDHRIRVLQNPESDSDSRLNALLHEAKATWICRLSEDASYEPDTLEAFHRGIQERPSARFFYSNYSLLIEESGCKQALPSGRQIHLPPFELQTLGFLQANFVSASTTCFQKSLTAEMGGWNPAYGLAQDLELWLRLSTKTRLHYLDHHTAIVPSREEIPLGECPSAAHYDSARGIIEFLNSHTFEKLFPWFDLRSPAAVTQAIESTTIAVLDMNALHYKGVGPNTALLDRYMDWVTDGADWSFREPLRLEVIRNFEGLKDLPEFIKTALTFLRNPRGSRYRPLDPIAMLQTTLQQQESAGVGPTSRELRLYLDKVAGVMGAGKSPA